MSEPKLQYTGEKQPQEGETDERGRPRKPYLPSDELVEAVNLAIYLERPLLLKGEPGCGKTRLAEAVAYELGLPLQRWPVKSTSRARDGLYTYDAVGRLRDAQLAANKAIEEVKPPEDYVREGPLGKAFRNSARTVVLIDEIDKADIDFPNDLLQELDEQCFVIDETEKTVSAKAAPIVFVTSNDEKDLPDAFLRRCVFHFVSFPEKDRLVEIVKSNFRGLSPKLLDRAVDEFLKLRKKMLRDKNRFSKKASTSELLDWVAVLQQYSERDALQKLEGKLPFAGVLLKHWEDHERYLGEEGEQP